MKKQYIVIPIVALAGLGIGIGALLNSDKVELVNDSIVIEAGTKLDFDISKYVKASESKIEKLTVDTSKVDTSKIGTYDIVITYKKQTLTLKVEVKDTTAPVISEPTEQLRAKVGEEVVIDNLSLEVKDFSDYKVTFEDGETSIKFDTVGEVKKKLIATDIYDNKSEIELTFKVTDAHAPVIYGDGTKNRTLYLENKNNLLDNVFAKDEEDGDITEKIKVSDVDLKTKGKKEVVYTVEDKSGNVTTKKVKIKVESIIEKADKDMYASTVANVYEKYDSDSKQLGSLSYAESVHVTGKVKGSDWYRIDFNGGSGFVKGSYLQDTKPYVSTPSQNKSSGGTSYNSNSSKSSGSSSSKNSGSSNTSKSSSNKNSGSNKSNSSSSSRQSAYEKALQDAKKAQKECEKDGITGHGW